MIVPQGANPPAPGDSLDWHALPDDFRHLMVIEDIARRAVQRVRACGAVLVMHGDREQGVLTLGNDGTVRIVIQDISGYPRGTSLRFRTMANLYRWLFDASPPDALPASLRIAPPNAAAIIAAFGATAGNPPLYLVGVPEGGTERTPIILPSPQRTRQMRRHEERKRGASC